MALIFVDVEGGGPAPGPLHDPRNFEFGAVEFKTRETFHGTKPAGATKTTFTAFAQWLNTVSPGTRPIFVSDNPAYDWQFINYYFHLHLGRNPMGHSTRRIGDFAAGLQADFYAQQVWKGWRETPHDHHPVHDAMGNVEAFVKLLELADRQRKALNQRGHVAGFSDTGWTLEHPMECRVAGLVACPYNDAMALTDGTHPDKGHWLVTMTDEALVIGERVR